MHSVFKTVHTIINWEESGQKTNLLLQSGTQKALVLNHQMTMNRTAQWNDRH